MSRLEVIPVPDLPDGGRGFADDTGDLVVAEREHLPQHEHGPLIGG